MRRMSSAGRGEERCAIEKIDINRNIEIRVPDTLTYSYSRKERIRSGFVVSESAPVNGLILAKVRHGARSA